MLVVHIQEFRQFDRNSQNGRASPGLLLAPIVACKCVWVGVHVGMHMVCLGLSVSVRFWYKVWQGLVYYTMYKV